jgi:uncharacterized protein
MPEPLPTLSATEVRVLGSLIEKQLTTPDYYPLTLNALTNACNQLTNRDPVVSFDETTIVRALDGLRDQRLATLFHGAESRVAKYKHALGDVLPLTPAQVAILCVLLLRGPQTVGELRTRTDRLFGFESLGEVETTLNELAAHDPAIVVKLPRQPGTKEARYAHLFSGAVELTAPERPVPMEAATVAVRAEDARFTQLAEEISDLRRDLAEVKAQFAAFRKQFE